MIAHAFIIIISGHRIERTWKSLDDIYSMEIPQTDSYFYIPLWTLQITKCNITEHTTDKQLDLHTIMNITNYKV